MILGIEMIISIGSYERKNIIFYKKKFLTHRINNYFNNFVWNLTFSYCRFFPIFLN